MLKMDINDNIQSVIVKNGKKSTTIDMTKTQQLAGKLTVVEKKDLADKHRIKGNEFYNATDFDEAIREYSLSIQIFPTASAFNNCAITYFKMNKLEMTIADCEQCLRLEPTNMKALLRKAQSLLNQSKCREAYDKYSKIISIDSNNEWAKSKMVEIKSKIPDLPPTNAFRMKIVEDEDEVLGTQKSIGETEYDFADLIIPNKIYPSKLSKLKSNFVLSKSGSDKKRQETERKKSTERKDSADDGIIIPTHRNGIIEEL